MQPRKICVSSTCFGAMPFLYIVLVSMLVVYIWPQIVLWLPKAIYGN